MPQGISTKLRRSVPCISTINSGLSAVVIGKVYVVEEPRSKLDSGATIMKPASRWRTVAGHV